MTTKPGTALALLAERVSVAPAELEQTLMQTAFKGSTKAEFMMLIAVANKYDLDPFVKEIYAFPKKGGGIVPLVPIDGWLKIINSHADFAGMDVRWADEMVKPSSSARECPRWVEVTIHHKSRPDHPTVHREWIDEMYRETGPWNGTTKRMLEWKGIIQTGRVAFGLSGIYDQDEAERINDGAYVVDAAADEIDSGQLIDETQHAALLAEMERTGLSEDSVRKNLSMKAGYTGDLADMPLIIFEALMLGLASMPGKTPPDDDPAGASPETPEGPVEGEVATAVETPAAPDEGSYWPTDDTVDPEAFGMDAEQARAHWAAKDAAKAEQRPRSAADAGRRAAESAERARAAKRIIQKQVNLLYAQCTIHGIDEKAQLHAWLREHIGVEHVPEIPAVRFDEVLGWVQAHDKGGVVA